MQLLTRFDFEKHELNQEDKTVYISSNPSVTLQIFDFELKNFWQYNKDDF